MTNDIASYQETQKLIAVAATWGRVAEREKYGEFGLSADNRSYFGSGPGIIEKSALFQRLLAGKKPLIYRPPTHNSYPWYEVIECLQRDHHVLVGNAPSLGSLLLPGANPGEPCILINGALWRIEETISHDQEYIVSWGRYPMKWKLFSKKENKGSVKEVVKSMTDIARSTMIANMLGRVMFHAVHNDPDFILMKSVKIGFDHDKKLINEISEESVKGDINFEIDENDFCWEKAWILQRIGLSGWPFAGEVLDVTQKEFVSLARDGDGDAVLFLADQETESNDPPGEAWIRIEHDAETNTSRYVSMYVSAQSKLEQKIQDECEKFLESLLDLAMSREESVFVMDRSESNKEILRLFRTRARP